MADIHQDASLATKAGNKPAVVHGLSYDHTFLNALPVLSARPAPQEPIRALSAAQFGEMHLQHLLSHPPDSVLFPFLHGLEGSNHAQNLFFASTSADEHGHLRVPNFRGLVWVAADEPTDGDVAGHPDWSDSDDSEDSSSSDLDAEDDTFRHGEAMQDAFGMPMDVDSDAEAMQAKDINMMPHMHPVAHRGAPFTPSASTTTVTATNVTALGRTSSSSTPMDILDYAYSAQPAAFSATHDRRASNASSMTSSAVSDTSSLFDSHARSLTSSTILSSPTTSPPSSPTAGAKSLHNRNGSGLASSSSHPSKARNIPLFTSTFRPKELLKSGPAGLEPVFIPPQVPEGISLRNFGIQVVRSHTQRPSEKAAQLR
jgi:dual specificity MAP kinase phosphatase